MATVIVRLANKVPLDSGPSTIRSILGDDAVQKIEQLFPDDPLPELASLFNVTLGSDALAAKAIDKLTKDKQIQYAHMPQERKAI
jgi:hypothetical protein